MNTVNCRKKREKRETNTYTISKTRRSTVLTHTHINTVHICWLRTTSCPGELQRATYWSSPSAPIICVKSLFARQSLKGPNVVEGWLLTPDVIFSSGSVVVSSEIHLPILGLSTSSQVTAMTILASNRQISRTSRLLLILQSAW